MFTLQIATDNAAFEGDDRKTEIARILRDVADRLEQGKFVGRLLDVNGNHVGRAELFVDGSSRM